MADAETDEMAQLMPRTRAATENADVNVAKLQEYMTAAQQDPSLALGARSSVMIRSDVRKDADGFEDIDDFWADDDVAGDKDDTEGEESSILSEGLTSSANVSMVSSASEMAVNLSGIDAISSDDDSDNGVDMEVDDDAQEPSGNDTMELDSQPSQRDDDEKSTTPTVTPKKQGILADRLTYGEEEAVRKEVKTPQGSAKKATPPAKVTATTPSPKMSSGSKAAQKKKLRRQSRDSFAGDFGFDDNIGSPFSIHDAVLTPLSNASEKNLQHSIKSFSENNSSAQSPNIRVTLFKSSEKGEDACDGDNNITRRKKPKVSTSTKKTKELSTPKQQKTKKIKYKSTPTSDFSFEEELTDNDDGSFVEKSAVASDDNDSDWGEKTLDISRTKSVRDGDLSYADEILRDADRDGDESGLRRSKRKRFKPLAWYKGEHYVYERRQSGVGLVIPTVAGVERVGSQTPMKKQRPVTNKKTTSRSRKQKPLPREKLPKEFKYDDGEWAELWDVAAGCPNKMNVICRSNEIEHRELPPVDELAPGYAGQSFNLRNPAPFSRWISGRLGLPPGAAKEAESVGDAVQVFFVIDCQPQSLEVAFGPAQDGYFDPKTATRFLLSPNDEFYIPAQNAYYLRNHSETATSDLHFMILKPDTKKESSMKSADSRESIGNKTPEQSPPSAKSRQRKRTKA